MLESVVWGQEGKGVEVGEASGCARWWFWPASPFPPSLSLLSGVPLLFVVPWGIVKHLYEDEG